MLINIYIIEAFLITVTGTNQEQPVSKVHWFQYIWKGVAGLLQQSQNNAWCPMTFYSNWMKVSGLLLIWDQLNWFIVLTETLWSWPTCHVILQFCSHSTVDMAEEWQWKYCFPFIPMWLQVHHDLFFTMVQRCKEYSDHWTQLHSQYDA